MFIKKLTIYGSFFITAILCSFTIGLSANAATVDDVAAVARSYGYSEAQIQAGYNAYYENPDKYPPELLDMVIERIHASGAQIIATAPQEPVDVISTTTIAQTPTEVQQQITTYTDQPVSTSITLTASDGTTFTRISREEFINMDYDDKMAYVHSFTQAQQQAIIDDLSPEEYKSLIKQSPVDQKMQIIGKISEAAEEMGINITVDEITDDSLTVAMRNDDGELLNVSTAGNAVEDTGYDRRGLFLFSAALICIGIFAAYFLMRRMDRTEN